MNRLEGGFDVVSVWHILSLHQFSIHCNRNYFYMDIKSINKRIEFVRTSLGISQKRFGKFIDVSQNTISGWESGAHDPPRRGIRLISEQFSIDFDWLESGTGAPPVFPKFHEYLALQFIDEKNAGVRRSVALLSRRTNKIVHVTFAEAEEKLGIPAGSCETYFRHELKRREKRTDALSLTLPFGPAAYQIKEEHPIYCVDATPSEDTPASIVPMALANELLEVFSSLSRPDQHEALAIIHRLAQKSMDIRTALTENQINSSLQKITEDIAAKSADISGTAEVVEKKKREPA